MKCTQSCCLLFVLGAGTWDAEEIDFIFWLRQKAFYSDLKI